MYIWSILTSIKTNWRTDRRAVMCNLGWRQYIIVSLLSGLVAFHLAAQANPTQVAIRSDAPTVYSVVKGDTLWDISELFLHDPWLWPRLWRDNPDIVNPHLIYPGDTIRIRYIDGQPELQILRAKPSLTLTPKGVRTVKTAKPIRNFDWQKVLKQLNQDRVVTFSKQQRGQILGNQNGSLLFAKDDTLFSQLPPNWTEGQLHAVRESHILYSVHGEPLGTVVHHIADVVVDELHDNRYGLVSVREQNRELVQGDWLLPSQTILPEDLFLHAAQDEAGVVIGGLEPREAFAEGDIVMVQHAAPLSVGLIMGLYQAGPDIQHSMQRTKYVDTDTSSWFVRDGLEQPNLKVGEVVIVHTQTNLSYGYVLNAQSAIFIGALSGRP